MSERGPRQRVDKWLWYARFFKTRGLAGEVAGSGRLRINGRHCTKPAETVGAGDELTFAQAGRIRAIRVEAVGMRRGPATEARTLYTDLAPPDGDGATPSGPDDPTASEPSRAPGGARPTKKARREIDRLGGGRS